MLKLMKSEMKKKLQRTVNKLRNSQATSIFHEEFKLI